MEWSHKYFIAAETAETRSMQYGMESKSYFSKGSRGCR